MATEYFATAVTEPLLWVPCYLEAIKGAAAAHGIPTNRIIATVWQESNGGIVPATGTFGMAALYRFEPAFWTRYLTDKAEYACPPSIPLHYWKRRVSASYGLMQVMFATARDLGYHDAPEGLLDPTTGLFWGAKYLRKCFNPAHDWHYAHNRYNGGGNPAYADEVEAKLKVVIEHGYIG